ncbi:methylated-DNA--cysteine S-met [Xylariomycetidae sp. FL2044]|nr:methylated-DNA--cysteine S-met [Xylariomycetidae sp. FL2044]
MAVGQKRKRTTAEEEAPTTAPDHLKKQAKPTTLESPSLTVYSKPILSTVPSQDMTPQLQRIAQSNRTAFEKRVWTLLCQIPAGSVSTYGLMSAHLGSSPRAVGNALRRNPFAPEVPCHRVVATGGALGGFKGRWPKDGEGITIDEKKTLLRKEGVKIDEKGRVLGTPWSGFV